MQHQHEHRPSACRLDLQQAKRQSSAQTQGRNNMQTADSPQDAAHTVEVLTALDLRGAIAQGKLVSTPPRACMYAGFRPWQL